MSQIIFAALITLLGLSSHGAYIGCDAPGVHATECWIITPDTDTTTILTPTGITYQTGDNTQ